MKTAVYAGSFDPPTLGHLWMIEQGAKSFDELVVAIGINPDKRYAFSVLERVIMLKEITQHLPNVRVEEFSNLYLIDYARRIGADVVLRGIRNEADYEAERTMRNVNGDINSSVTTFFLMPPREIAEISSSFVKGMIGPQCWERRIRGFLPTAVYEKTLLNWLWERWDRLFQAIGAKGSSRGFFERVTNPYTDAARKYHNLAHLVHILIELESFEEAAPEPLSYNVWLAAWYHDVVYDLTEESYSQNELRSAEFAEREIVEMGLPYQFAHRVGDLIQTTTHKDQQTDSETQILLDADLAILGQPSDIFDQYDSDVALEYSWVEVGRYRGARVGILRGFLERERIYQTKFFHEKYDPSARENLERAIARLSS